MILLIAALLAAAEAATPPPEDDPVRTLAAAQDMYNQSCGVKGYASYDDLCGALRSQIREAEKAADKAKADAKRAAKSGQATSKPIAAAAPVGAENH